MKFFNLFRKELKEMLSIQTILSMVVTVIVLSLAGQAMSKAMSDSSEESQDITICDQDNTDFTKAFLSVLETQTKDNNGSVTYVDIGSEDYVKELKNLDIKNVVIIPKGFSQQVENHETAKLKFVQRMTSLATMSNISTGSDNALAIIQASVKSTIYGQKITDGTMTQAEMLQLESPVELEETTVVGDKSDNISSSIVLSMCSLQNMIVPIIMFILIMFSSQMILNAISTEKLDKTLETLLSAPVSRLSVISAKMLSAGVVAALQAVLYMFGMKNMMSGMTDSMGDTSAYTGSLEKLGLTMNAGQYALVGVQMFLSILIALSLSLILGALAKDAKSAQTLVLPITFSAMIPYMLAMFVDLKTLTPVVKYIVYAIPFTHTFMASENTMFNNTGLYLGGVIYQLIFLTICMTLALKLFMSDRIFTMSLGGGSRKKKGFAFLKNKK